MNLKFTIYWQTEKIMVCNIFRYNAVYGRLPSKWQPEEHRHYEGGVDEMSPSWTGAERRGLLSASQANHQQQQHQIVSI